MKFEDQISVLIVDDDEGDRKEINRKLKKIKTQISVSEASTIEDALSLCETNRYDFILLDYLLPDSHGLDGIKNFLEKFPHTCIIMVTGQGDEIVASEAIKKGASDYISKKYITPFALHNLFLNAIKKSQLQKQIDQQRKSLVNFNKVLAHDLKDPLNHINLFADMINNEIEDNNYENIKSYTDILQSSSKRLIELINTLGQYNSINLENESILSMVSLDDIVDKAIDNLSIKIKDKNAKVTKDNMPKIVGNEPLLIQLYQNLIQNGLKYNDKETPEIHLGVKLVDDVQIFSVQDNGIGIDQKFFRKIFEEFTRLHPSGDSKYDGTGLGLSSCKLVIDRHNGEIWCESEVGKGTTFLFTLNSST